MKIQATLTPSAAATPASFAEHIVAEERAVWEAYESGILREMYFQKEPLTVVLVFEVQSHQEVSDALAEFPMVTADLLDMHFVTLGHRAPLAALFAPSK